MTDMFSQKGGAARSWYEEFFGSPNEEVKTIGRLQGQFNFRVLSSSNVLMVNATNPEYYKVVDDLVAELDQPYGLGLPADRRAQPCQRGGSVRATQRDAGHFRRRLHHPPRRIAGW